MAIETQTVAYQVWQLLKVKLSDLLNAIIVLFAEGIVRLLKCSPFKEYLAEHGTIQIYKTMKNNS